MIAGPDGIIFDETSGVIARTGFKSMVKLTKHQTTIVSVLLNARGGQVLRAPIMNALYGIKPDCDWPKTVGALSVQFTYIRRKIRPLRLTLVSVRDFGWAIRDSAR